ncbi:Holliday junction branch migration protein RuvA [Longispora sp. NPDC051575]|uniref:Holliday junction branch migration protein RuvA n=1 Tax=Longispora sp. NPDC051575 TaxID=3154943 RepID=UPI00342A35E9
MIASVRGQVTAIGSDTVVVEVGGVGLALHCSPGTLADLRVGAQTRLAASLVVREDSLTLYGFADDDAKSLFELLQTASGVGPRVAQSILAVHSPDAVRVAIATADTAALTRVPGIGKKGAERLVLELRDKIGAVAVLGDGGVTTVGGAHVWQEQVRQALIGLGWIARDAESAVSAVHDSLDKSADPPPVPVLLKQAIRMLGRTR